MSSNGIFPTSTKRGVAFIIKKSVIDISADPEKKPISQ